MPSTVDPMKTIPDGYTTVTPWLISTDTARELDFIRDAFGGEELARVVGADGAIGHAETRIGDAVVLLFDAPDGWPATPCFLRLYVEDADETFRRATAAGATAVTEPTELFWGDKVGRVRDPLGNVWWIQQRVAELTDEEVAERMVRPEFVAAMAYVTSAKPFAS
jgi:PhnB protein